MRVVRGIGITEVGEEVGKLAVGACAVGAVHKAGVALVVRGDVDVVIEVGFKVACIKLDVESNTGLAGGREVADAAGEGEPRDADEEEEEAVAHLR